MRATAATGIVVMMDSSAETIRVTLELQRAGDRMVGSLHDGARAPRPFDGWLELGTLLEEARRGAPADTPDAARSVAGQELDQ